MIKVISTRYGQLVAKVNKEQGVTQILNEDMTSVATVQQISKEGVVRSINLIASFLNRKAMLEANGIRLEAGADQLQSIDSDSFTEESEEQPTYVAPVVGAENGPPPLAAAQVTPKAAPKAARKGAKRGRKPGQKVKRNPELAW